MSKELTMTDCTSTQFKTAAECNQNEISSVMVIDLDQNQAIE